MENEIESFLQKKGENNIAKLSGIYVVSTNYQKFQKYTIHILGKITLVFDLVNY